MMHFIQTKPRTRARQRALLAVLTMVFLFGAVGRSPAEILGTAPVAARSATAAPQVQQSHGQRSDGCAECRAGNCRNARHRMLHEQRQRPHAGHHAQAVCRGGECSRPGCPACCPVRPGRFGFYGTEWRNWPGSGQVVQASYDAAATPAMPPKSEVPTADEESPGDGDETADGDETDLGPADGSSASPPSATEPESPVPTLPAPAATQPQPESMEPAAPAPGRSEPAAPAEPSPPPAAAPESPSERAENLFDEATLHRQRYQRFELLNQNARRREQSRQEALRQSATLLPRSLTPSVPPTPEPMAIPEPIMMPEPIMIPEPIAMPEPAAAADSVTPVGHEQPIRSANPMRSRETVGRPASNPLR